MSQTSQYNSDIPQTSMSEDAPDQMNFEIIDDDTDAVFITHDDLKSSERSGQVWKIAIVDDDKDVHEATDFALRGFEVFGRPVQLLHANSGAEGLELFKAQENLAVAFIDVVMETNDAGLTLVEQIRKSGNDETRLVLRTGQPGYAPELKVLQDYDINDYRTKSELTRSRLLSVLTSAIRSYNQIRTINEIRSGLELVVDGMPELFCRNTLGKFSRGVLMQVASLLHVPASGLVCISDKNLPHENLKATDMRIISDAGRFNETIGCSLSDIGEQNVLTAFEECLLSGKEITSSSYMGLCFKSGQGRLLFVYLDCANETTDSDLALLKVFSGNIAVTFDNVQLIEQLDSLAYIDPVLEIPNRNAFEKSLTALIEHAKVGWIVALLRICDLESIESTYGNNRTNEYLQSIYTRMLAEIDGGASIARIADNVFGILIEGTQFDINTIQKMISRPIKLGGTQLSLTTTTAIADIVPGQGDAKAIMRNAHAALIYANEKHKGGFYRYEESIRRQVSERIRYQSAIIRDMDAGQGFELHLQPKINIASGQFVGVEALTRWRVDDKYVSPVKFIPIIETSGLSQSLLDFLINEVSRWVADRKAERLPPLPVAMNLSVCDLRRDHFAHTLLNGLAEVGLDSTNVQFEITESGLMESFDDTVREITQIKEAGYKIAVDDFGTGYSSLSYLEKLPLDILKIDRCFIENLTIANARHSIAATSIALAHSLNLEVVAEGIETKEQHQVMRFLGCSVCQGYFYAKPVSSGEFQQRFQNWSMEALLN